MTEDRFTVAGACGGAYAVIWDRQLQRIIFPDIRTGAEVSDNTVASIVRELNDLTRKEN